MSEQGGGGGGGGVSVQDSFKHPTLKLKPENVDTLNPKGRLGMRHSELGALLPDEGIGWKLGSSIDFEALGREFRVKGFILFVWGFEYRAVGPGSNQVPGSMV